MAGPDMGTSRRYSEGTDAATAVGSGTAVSVYKHDTWLWGKKPYYRVANLNSMTWSDEQKLDFSLDMGHDVAMFEEAVVVVGTAGTSLKSIVGVPDGSSPSWGEAEKFDEGTTPTVSAASDGHLVQIHEPAVGSKLWCSVGRVDVREKRTEWTHSVDFGSGSDPDVAVNDDGLVVHVHQAPGSYTLRYRVGRVEDGRVHWTEDAHEYSSGTLPKVALANDGRVVAVHNGKVASGLYYSYGRVQADGTIAWENDDPIEYDGGNSPSLSMSPDGDTLFETHESSYGHSLWYHDGSW